MANRTSRACAGKCHSGSSGGVRHTWSAGQPAARLAGRPPGRPSPSCTPQFVLGSFSIRSRFVLDQLGLELICPIKIVCPHTLGSLSIRPEQIRPIKIAMRVLVASFSVRSLFGLGSTGPIKHSTDLQFSVRLGSGWMRHRSALPYQK